ncbi:MAG: hypothetical protein QOH05_1391 [Acetobacteraceae bacterium]|nr:hypothetical protein [Acetobacteraceae bacterium]
MLPDSSEPTSSPWTDRPGHWTQRALDADFDPRMAPYRRRVADMLELRTLAVAGWQIESSALACAAAMIPPGSLPDRAATPASLPS